MHATIDGTYSNAYAAEEVKVTNENNHSAPPSYVGIGSVALALGVSRETVRNMEKRGVLPAAERLEPGSRRVWPATELQEIRKRVEERAADRQQSHRETVAV